MDPLGNAWLFFHQHVEIGGVVIPGWSIDLVSLAPGGSRPSYSLGLTERDNDFYRAWDEISRDRESFSAWMQQHVLEAQPA